MPLGEENPPGPSRQTLQDCGAEELAQELSPENSGAGRWLPLEPGSRKGVEPGIFPIACDLPQVFISDICPQVWFLNKW